MTTKTTPAPEGLGTSGRKLWRSILDDYDLSVAEQLQLTAACRVADRLDALAAELEGEPLTVTNGKGDQTTHPLIVESRQQSITLTRLLAALRLPTGETDDGQLVRPQRRGGARGAYGVQPLHVVGGAS